MKLKIFAACAALAIAATPAYAQTGIGNANFGSESAFGGTSNFGGANQTTGAAGAAAGSTDFGTPQLDSSFGVRTIAGVGVAESLLGGGRQQALGGLGGFGGGGFGGGGFGGGGFGGGGANQLNNQNRSKVRATVKIGFDYPMPTRAVRAQNINARLARIPLPAKYSSVMIRVDGRQAIIDGQVPSVEDGKLIERLMSLEPGIDGVDNRLVYVAGDASQGFENSGMSLEPVSPLQFGPELRVPAPSVNRVVPTDPTRSGTIPSQAIPSRSLANPPLPDRIIPNSTNPGAASPGDPFPNGALPPGGSQAIPASPDSTSSRR